MEKAKNVVVAFILLSLVICVLVSAQIYPEKNDLDGRLGSMLKKHEKHKHSGLSEADCGGACTYRCSKTAYKKPCMFFCQKCCFKCRCVPPGTYGNKQVCPCYNNWITHTGGPKCP